MKHYKFFLVLAALMLLTTPKAHAQTIAWRGLAYTDYNYFNPATTFMDTTRQTQVSVWGKYRIQQINVSGEHPLDAGFDYQGRVGKRNEWMYSAGFIWDGYSFMNMYNFYGSIAYRWNWGKRSLSIGTRMRMYTGHILWDKMAVQIPDRYGKDDAYIFPDFDLGIDYRVKYYSLRISTLNVFSPRVGANSLTLVNIERKWILDNHFECNIQNKVMMIPHFLLAFGAHTIYGQIGLYIDFWHYVHISADVCGAELNQMYSIGTTLPCGLDIDLGAEHAPNHDSQNIDVKLSYRF